MRTGVSMLGNIETEQTLQNNKMLQTAFSQLFQQSFATGNCFSHDGVRIEENTDDDSIGAQFLPFTCVVKSQMNCGMNK